MSVRVFGGGLGGGSFLGQASLANTTELRVYIEGLVSGVDINARLQGYSRWGSVGQVSDLNDIWAYRAGATAMLYVATDGRRWLQPQPAAGAFSTAYLRRWNRTGLQLDAIEFRQSYNGTVTPVAADNVPPFQAVRIGSWIRKVAAGDATSCRTGLFFADNTFLSPTALIARCGFFGDGALGFGFGSVNCPDGGGAVENGHGDRDANFIQPAELVNPGTTAFYVDVTMVPPTPVQDGFWYGRLNGRLVSVGGNQSIFRTLVNFPRGAGGVNNDFARIEGLWLSNEGTQGRVQLYGHPISAVWTENLTLG